MFASTSWRMPDSRPCVYVGCVTSCFVTHPAGRYSDAQMAPAPATFPISSRVPLSLAF